MKQGGNLNDDAAVILCCFADFLDEDGMGLDDLCRYIMHCGIKTPAGMSVGDAILTHYRNPLGYDIDRAAMDLRTWPPIAARITELQTDEAERRANAKAKRVRRIRAMNGHAAGEHSI